MQNWEKYCFGLLLAIACSYILSAQTSDSKVIESGITFPGINNSSPFVIRTIFIVGNKKTKDGIILRELPFKTGDQYQLQELVAKFEQGRRQLMNTTLFLEVVVALKSFDGYNVDILVKVRERWYIFPLPYLRPVDRNFNQWLVEHKGSLNRLDYGVKLLYNNITGRNDKFRVWLVNGYTKEFSFEYNRLYIDKALKWGGGFKFDMGKNHEINYNTIGNKQVFFTDSNFYLRKFINATAEVSYRPAINTKHRFGIGYIQESVSDTVVALNPSYFPAGSRIIQYPELYYDMTFFDVDYIPYPTKGYGAEFTFVKRGFTNNFNTWEFTFKGSANWHLFPKTYLNLRSFATIKLPFNQPFYNQHLLGYSDVFMQGYEYYVVDGVARAYLKTAVTKELFKIESRLKVRKRDEPINVPIRIFVKIYGDVGYVYNPQPGQNFLVNEMLYSSGIGVDIFTIYDFTLKLEWTFNQLGQNGLFLHRLSNF